MLAVRVKLCLFFFGAIVQCQAQVDTESGDDKEAYKDELFIDHRVPPTGAEKLQHITQELPSLPLDFYERHKYHQLRLSENCAEYPEIWKLQFHNNYWQVYRIGSLTFYLYGAYYDKRTLVQRRAGAVLVRILAMINAIDYKFEDYPTSHCQLWFEEQRKPLIVPVREYRQIWYSPWGNDPQDYYATFVECALPKTMSHLVPQTVSLVHTGCARATNNLRVIYEPAVLNHTQRGFAVCSTGLFNPYRDNSVRLVEWLELLRLLGAEHVMLPTFGIHPNATKVLQYYARAGYVSAPGISLVRGEPALPHFTHVAIEMSMQNHRLNEVIPLNDCLYRNMYKYEYVAVLDVDEVIMPLGELSSWAHLVRYAKTHIRYDYCDSLPSLCFRNVYFPAYPTRKLHSAEVPSYMYMLQHVARLAAHSAPLVATKCFHNTSTVTAVHNHYPMHWLEGCDIESAYKTVGQLQHYREPEIPETLKDPVIDDAIWRYARPLVKRTQMVLRELELLRRIKVQKQDTQDATTNKEGGTAGKERSRKAMQETDSENDAVELYDAEKLVTVTERPVKLITTSKMWVTKVKRNEL